MPCRILVPLDASAGADCCLRQAIALAARENARLCLLHVVDPEPSEPGTARPWEARQAGVDAGRQLLERARRAASAAGVGADTTLREAPRRRVAQVIREEAGSAGCDLIVMGTHGQRPGGSEVLGDNAEGVARGSAIPVMLFHEGSGKS